MATKRGLAHILGDDGSPYEQLVMAVIWRAAEDARAGDPLARAWLSSSAAAYWYDAVKTSARSFARN
jgi:hypothetical protein